ncbi:MAG TPA: glucuronate isomerase [Acidobacteriota bacterium]|jgi:hypothetical protein
MKTANSETKNLEKQPITTPEEIRRQVGDKLASTPVFDMHTHLFPPQFGELNLWGIDELLTYHYLIAELFRSSQTSTDDFWKLRKSQQADLIWETLFVRNTPLSEATRGVVAVLTSLGLDPSMKDLRGAREFFRTQEPEDYLTRVLQLANVSDIVMTNDPFDEAEARIWESGVNIDGCFHSALRLDSILNALDGSVPKMKANDYIAEADLRGNSVAEIRRFVDTWIERISPIYAAVSLPHDFRFPDDSVRNRLLQKVIIPVCREHRLPFALMIGVRRQINPALRLAGDGLGYADIRSVERLCAAYPDIRFLVTMLARENQHELCVAARKFSNLLPFGCWWFLNNPSIVSEITFERIELLGASFIPQHSDARVLDQLIYKWQHNRRVLADVLCQSYNQLALDGRAVTGAEINRDVSRLLFGNFKECVGM